MLDPYAADSLAASVARLPRQDFSSVLHLGAGRDTDVSIYRRLQSDEVILVGAGEPPARGIEAASVPSQRVEFVDTCVSAGGGTQAWHRYNVPRFDGLVDVRALSAHYPRLALVGVDQRETRSVSALVSELPPCRRPGDRLLVIDLPGQAALLLRALSDEALRSFGIVIARQCPLLGDGFDELRQATPWHRHVSVDTLADPLFPVSVLWHDQSAFEREALAGRIKAVEAERNDAQARAAQAHEAAVAQRDEARSVVESLQRRLAESDAARSAELLQWQRTRLALEVERNGAQAEAAQAAQAREAAIAQRDEARGEAETLKRRLAESDATRSAELQQSEGARQALEAELDRARAEAETLTRRISELTESVARERASAETERADHAEQAAQITSLTDANERTAAEKLALQQQLESLSAALRKAEHDLEGLRQTSRQEVVDWQQRAEWLERELNQARQGQLLASKLQLLRENDLKDLQDRYRELAVRQQNQRELLSKLAQRLTLAQEYFQQLPHWQGDSSG